MGLKLQGRSHQRRPEATDTPAMISPAVEISISGGGVDKNHEDSCLGGFFFFSLFFFFYHLFVVKVQETIWSTTYDRNKTLTIQRPGSPPHMKNQTP